MKRVVQIAGALLAVVLLGAIALPFLVDANRFRPELESRLKQALGREVKVGNLKLSLFSGGVTADDLSIADDPSFSRSPFVQAKSLQVGVDLPGLIFSRKLTVTGVSIDQPQIQLLEAASGAWNFSSIGTQPGGKPAEAAPPGGGSKLDLAVKLVKISQGRFTMGHAGARGKPLVLENVNAELHDFAVDQAFPFSVGMTVAGGGSIKLDGKAGPLNQSDLVQTPAAIRLKVDQLDLAGSGLNEVAPDTAGVVSFDGTGESGPAGVDLAGKLKMGKLKLSARGAPANRTLELDFHVTRDWKTRSGAVKQADVHFGGAVVRMTGTYVPEGESLAIRANVEGPNMPVEELAEMLPAMGIVLPNGSSLKGGTAMLKATVEGPANRLVTNGTVSVTNTRLTGFNLSSRLSGIERLAGIRSEPDTEIQEFSGNVKFAPEGLNADGIKLVLPAIGDVAGSGTVHPDNHLDFRFQAAVHAGGIAALLDKTPVPFVVEGTCAEPVFRPDLKAVVKGEIKDVEKAAGGLLRGLLGGKK